MATFETQADREAQREIVKKFCDWCQIKCKKPVSFEEMPTLSRHDFEISIGSVKRIVAEAKDRDISFELARKLGGFKMSAGKWDACFRSAAEQKLHFILTIRFAGWVAYCKAKPDDPQTLMREVWGRSKPRPEAPHDIEQCVIIPMSRFTLISVA